MKTHQTHVWQFSSPPTCLLHPKIYPTLCSPHRAGHKLSLPCYLAVPSNMVAMSKYLKCGQWYREVENIIQLKKKSKVRERKKRVRHLPCM